MKKIKQTTNVIPLTYQKTALLVIDVQQALFEKRLPIFQGDAMLAKINLLEAQARRAQIPVIYIQHCNQRDMLPGSTGWSLHPGLSPDPGDKRISKNHSNAFKGTELNQVLEQNQVGKLVIVGLVSHGCIKAACQEALTRGYQVILAADAHSSFSEKAAELIEETNQKMRALGATVLPVDEIVFPAGH